MANAFNMLRSNDLIWPYVINNYLKGKQPYPFDLLYWNSDSTRMPAANHSFYLRNCYLENKLSTGEMEIAGDTLDLGNVNDPDLQSGDPRGPHRAGEVGVPRLEVLRRPGEVRARRLGPYRRRGQSARQEGKYQYWTGDAPVGNLDSWFAKATEHPGSWWPDWLDWIKAAGRRAASGARARRRQAQADRGRAGQLREDQRLIAAEAARRADPTS